MAADPAATDVAAKREGLSVIDRLRSLRAEFGLSLAAAKAVIDASDGRPPLFPKVTSPDELEAALGAELGYCGCASRAAIVVLRDLLRVARDRSDASGDAEAFARASRRLEALLDGGGG